MNCKKCNSENVIKKGFRGIRQRYHCTKCKFNFQDKYIYNLYSKADNQQIKILNAEGVGIRSMSRILGYSTGTIQRKILGIASQIIKPIYYEKHEVYEIDEMWTYIGKNKPENYCWITYAINRRTRTIIDVLVGSRT